MQKQFNEKNVHELHNCHEVGFNMLTETFYQSTPWPDPEIVVGPLVNDSVFLIFYTELYYRHLYALTAPKAEQHFKSFENYCKLFNHFLSSDNPVDIVLPVHWAWDIIDEFIYQFNTFTIYRSKVVARGKSTADFNLMKEKPDIWSAYSVLNVLYSLAGKSDIVEKLKKAKIVENSKPVSGDNIYETLGYFSLIGLLHVHTLLGDFLLALESINVVELNKKAFFNRVPAAHYTVYYYVGFSYLMLKRYADAIILFSHILLFISRTKNINRSPQFNAVSKKSDQMFALLTICVALTPTRLDATVNTSLREKYGEKLYKIQKGSKKESLQVIEELFTFAAPKFVSPSVPDFVYSEVNGNPFAFHKQLFIAKVESAVTSPPLKNYLRLYSSLHIEKLKKFLETTTDNEIFSILVNYNMQSLQLTWQSGNDVLTNTSDIHVVLDKDLVLITEKKASRKFGEWFIRNTAKNILLQDTLRRV